MLKKFAHVALAAALSVAALTAPASADSPSNAFSLKNNSDKTLHFSYRCTAPFKSDMNDETIAAGDNYDYWVKGCSSYEVVKTTSYDDQSERTFRYTLDPGKQYELAWDQSKNAWDFHILGRDDVAFHLKNLSDTTLHFNMRCTSPTTSMEAETIPAGKTFDFWIDGCSAYEVVKSTDYDDSSTKTFRYSLEPTKTYSLGWDQSADAWNFHICDSDGC